MTNPRTSLQLASRLKSLRSADLTASSTRSLSSPPRPRRSGFSSTPGTITRWVKTALKQAKANITQSTLTPLVRGSEAWASRAEPFRWDPSPSLRVATRFSLSVSLQKVPRDPRIGLSAPGVRLAKSTSTVPTEHRETLGA